MAYGVRYIMPEEKRSKNDAFNALKRWRREYNNKNRR